jgi:hypothetical protein
MVAQHAAEGGVLGEVRSRSESPGDDTGSHTDSSALGELQVRPNTVHTTHTSVVPTVSVSYLQFSLSGGTNHRMWDRTSRTAATFVLAAGVSPR